MVSLLQQLVDHIQQWKLLQVLKGAAGSMRIGMIRFLIVLGALIPLPIILFIPVSWNARLLIMVSSVLVDVIGPGRRWNENRSQDSIPPTRRR